MGEYTARKRSHSWNRKRHNHRALRIVVSYKIEQEFRTREAELGYEKLVEANTAALWQAQELAKQKGDNAPKLQELRENSDNSYIAARQKIAAFGDAAVIEALSSYYSKHQEAWKPCPDKKKFASDTKIYAAIRNTLGVFRSSVSDEQIANVVFLCSLK